MRAFDPTAPVPAGISLLEASAGTGKTYSITSIVLRLVVEETLPLEQLLVVTFTEAATAELRDRVRVRLREALEAYATPDAAPDDGVVASLLAASRAAGTLDADRGRLRCALEEYDRAAISTIHGFCARVLREHAFECGAEFDAELLEDAGELLDEIVHDFWARTVAERPRELVRALCERGMCVARFEGLARRVAADPELEIVPAEPATSTATSWLDVHGGHRTLLEHARTAWRSNTDDVDGVLAAATASKILNGRSWTKANRPRWIAEMRDWASGADDELPKNFSRFTRSGLRASAVEGREEDVPDHPTLAVCDRLVESGASLDAACTDELLILDHALARYVRAEMVRRKRVRRVHTFDDLLRLVRDALRSAEHGDVLAGALRQRYRAALIDEFQDTDGVQWEIFRRVFHADGHRLVLIGDPKQAIYGFRGADVHAYLAARQVAGDAVLGLATNRRSDRGLVAAVNRLFGRLERPFAEEGIAYPAVEAHHGDRLRDPSRGAPLQLRFLAREAAAEGAAPRPLTKAAVNADVCHLVAADVVRTLRSGATIATDGAAGTTRPVSPGDCAVLVRSHHQARDVQRALRRVGVPSVLHGAQSVFLIPESEELEAVLRATLEPSNMRLVRGALATDLLGLALADEAAVDAEQEAELPGIGDALALLDEDERRLERWLDRLTAWSRTWAERGVMPMLRAVMDELSLPERLLALEDGERRLTNLRHLGELLHDAAVTRALDGPALVAWLGRQRTRSDVDEDARQLRLESDADAVQVVTIHASKGLEYPLVWCPYLWDGKLTGGDDDEFVRCRATTATGAVRRLDVAKGHEARAEHERQRDAEQFAEGLRLLYVALTRARHRCVVHWAIANDCGGSGLAHLLHGADGPSNAAAALDAARAAEQLDDAAVLDALQAIADASGGTISVAHDTREEVERWVAPAAERRPLEARRWRRATPLDTSWRVGSFTGMTRGAKHHVEPEAEAPEAVADARPAPGVDTDVSRDAPAPVLLEAFPSSAKAGIFFHEVLERHDFTRPDELPPLVQRTLGAHGFDAARWEAPVATALQAVIETPLTAGDRPLRLAEVGPADRLNELRFELPLCGGLDARGSGALTPATLAAVLRDHPGGTMPTAYADRVASLGFGALRGFLTGAIDLVVRHGGRWYVVDHKSNRLGAAPDDYDEAAVAAEMSVAHYYLQYHLYVLALHRYLAWRVPGYDYDRDVGGVLYLFLRGMRPESGPSRGVHFDRPPRARVEALDALCAQEALA